MTQTDDIYVCDWNTAVTLAAEHHARTAAAFFYFLPFQPIFRVAM
jgi:hypothetical protein